LSNIAGPIVAKFIISDKTDYLLVFWIGTCFTLFSFVSVFFFKEEVFIYKKEITPGNEEKKEVV
jgi:hypothetical protein